MGKLLTMTIGMSACLLSGCANINATKAENTTLLQQTKALNDQINHVGNDQISFSHRPYLGNDIITLNDHAKLPSALKRKLTLICTEPQTLTKVLDDLSSVAGIDIVLTQNAIDFLTGKSQKGQSATNDKKLTDFIKTKLSAQFSNISLHEVLNRITRATNLFWRYDAKDKRISIFRSTSSV